MRRGFLSISGVYIPRRSRVKLSAKLSISILFILLILFIIILFILLAFGSARKLPLIQMSLSAPPAQYTISSQLVESEFSSCAEGLKVALSARSDEIIHYATERKVSLRPSAKFAAPAAGEG